MNKRMMQAGILILALTMALLPGAAAIFADGECATAEIQGISPSSVGIDEEFTLGINLESCGTRTPRDVTFTILSIPSDITVTEDLVTKVPELYYSASERYIRYHMRTKPNAEPGLHTIKMQLAYGPESSRITEDYEIEIRVLGEDAEPRISSVETNPEYIYEGDTVDLQLGIENYGEAIAKSVSVSLEHDFKGTKDFTIGTLSVNETQNALFKFKASKAGRYEIPVVISYEDDFGLAQAESEIKITVLEKKGVLNLASVKVDPVLPKVGDTIELTMRVENFGDRTINSVRVYVDHPFEGLKEAFIGTLDPDEDGPAVITFKAEKDGEYEIPVTITYADDFGEEQVETSINLIVLKSNGVIGPVIAVLVILAVIGGLVFYIYRMKASKDRIIRQLMKGNGNSKKK